MWLIARRKRQEVQRVLLNVANRYCRGQDFVIDGPREEKRVPMTVAVLIIPVIHGSPVVEQAFSAVTRECSTTGMSVVLDGPRPLDEVIVGLRGDPYMQFLRAKAIHTSPVGAGFFQIGLQATEVVPAGDYPDLTHLFI